MDTPESEKNSEYLDNQIQALERLEQQAGITQTMQRARADWGQPARTLGEQATPRDYVAEDYDQRRVATRDAYFSVDDEAYRKQLIGLSRRIDRRHRQSTINQIEAAQNEIAIVRLARRPWRQAALLGLALVAFGYWASELAGAIAGGVAAVFLTLGLIVNAHNNARLKLAQATRRLDQAKKAQADYSLFPEIFSAAEEASGRRDINFGLKSAYRNTRREQSEQT